MAANPGVSRCTCRNPVAAHGGPEAVEIAASGLSQQHDPPSEVAERSRLPRAASRSSRPTRTKAASSAAGSTQQPINAHLTKDIGLIRIPARHQLVGATVVDRLWCGRVRRPAPAVRPPASRSTAVACLHDSCTGTGVCYADFLSAGFSLIRAVPQSDGFESVRDVFDIYTIIFWRWRCSSSCACAACSASALAASGRPMTLFRRATPVRGATNDNVVTLAGPRRRAAQKPLETAEPVERWKGIAEAGSTLAAGLDAIAREDKSFDAQHFVAGARAAYEMIVTGLCRGRPPHAQEPAVARGL